MDMNVSSEDQMAQLLRLLGQPIRIQILYMLGEDQACVCHLETVLGERQAVISQHLMVLRDAGLVTAVRDGRNIFYHLTQPALLEILHASEKYLGISPESLEKLTHRPAPGCPCPLCNVEPTNICPPIGTSPLHAETCCTSQEETL